jgi:hypothetical protein
MPKVRFICISWTDGKWFLPEEMLTFNNAKIYWVKNKKTHTHIYINAKNY